MNIWRLSIREIAHRKLGFVLGLVSVAFAVGCLVGAYTLLSGHDLRTEQVIAQKEAETRREMDELEDYYRRIMKDMGYNVLVVHKDQSFEELERLGHATHYMPEQYVHRLADEEIESLNHLLPILQQRLYWPEQGREVMVAGVRGQVPIFHLGKADMKPIMDPVEPGELKLGSEIAADLDLAEGDTVTLSGTYLRIAQVYKRRGTLDDQTIWVQLEKVQAWLGKPGMINGILALECICDPMSVGKLQQQVTEILPDTRVYEFTSLIVARALARQRAAEAHERAIAAEIEYRGQLRDERQAFAGVLVPVVVAGATVWVFFLVLGNVRERREEIGILRALGVSSGRIQQAFVFKAVLTGLVGGVIGAVAGLLVGAWWSQASLDGANIRALVNGWVLLAAVVGAPLLATLASWLPASLAARQDPAIVLRED